MFFIIVVISCVVTYIVTAMLKIDPNFGIKGYNDEAEATDEQDDYQE